MSEYRKMPVVIEATQWFKNGDHPGDAVGETLADPMGGPDYKRLEGKVVRFFRHPEIGGTFVHADLPDTRRPKCEAIMHDHGWIDTLEGGHTVCPGDWIITGIQGEVYPCEPSIFDATYEPVEQTNE